LRGVVLATLGFLLATRVYELVISNRNAARLDARGGVHVEPDGFGLLVFAHVTWLLGMPIEELTRGPLYHQPVLQVGLALLFVAAELTRLWTVRALGDRWCARVIVLPGVPRVRSGPYRYLDHPNYVAVVVGVIALPLALGLPLTAMVATPLKMLALRRRTRIEERALSAE
jgi:methyltransferase